MWEAEDNKIKSRRGNICFRFCFLMTRLNKILVTSSIPAAFQCLAVNIQRVQV